MGPLNDFQDFRGRLDRNLDQLADADMVHRNRDEIRRWLQHVDSKLKISSLGESLNKIRISAERADLALGIRGG